MYDGLLSPSGIVDGLLSQSCRTLYDGFSACREVGTSASSA